MLPWKRKGIPDAFVREFVALDFFFTRFVPFALDRNNFPVPEERYPFDGKGKGGGWKACAG